jgi:O-antigen/teichoic acid export membrane protein
MKKATPAEEVIRTRLGFLFKDSVVYGGAAAITQAFTLITFPLLTRHFAVEEYGVLDYFMVLSSFLVTLFIFGQDSGVARYFYEYEDRADRCQIISESLVFQFAGLALILPLLWWVAEWLAGFLPEVPDNVRLFKIVLLQIPFLLLINFSLNLLKWTFARDQYLIMTMGFTVVRASLFAGAILVFDVGIEEVLLISLATSIVFGLLGILLVSDWLQCPKKFKYMKQMLRFSIPLGVICGIGAFSPALERTLTEQLLGASDLGLYSAGTKIAMLIGLIVGAFQTAWGPFSLSIHKLADAGKTFNWVLKLFAMFICVMVLVLNMLAQPLINLLASDRYAGAAVVVFPLAMGMAIEATSWITEIGIGISKRSQLNLFGYALFVVTTLACILLLAPVLGLLGLALGVMIGHIVKALLNSWLAQRAYPLPWNYAQVIAVFGLTLIVGFGSYGIGQRWGAQANTGALIAGMIAVLGLGWGVLLTTPERHRAIAYVMRKLSKASENL